MNKDILYFLLLLLLFLIIDLPVILFYNYNMYQKQFSRINNGIKLSRLRIWLSAFFTYILLAFSLLYFIVKPEINFKTRSLYSNIFFKGFILGFIIYGVYNGTNMATINNWGFFESCIDTIWGSLLYGILSVITIFLINYFIYIIIIYL